MTRVLVNASFWFGVSQLNPRRKGTRMIPISPPRSHASQTGYAPPETRATRVLVIEDDLMIGAAATEALEEVGFVVLKDVSPKEAEIILNQELLDVLLTDIDLGGLDGWDLAHEALKSQP